MLPNKKPKENKIKIVSVGSQGLQRRENNETKKPNERKENSLVVRKQKKTEVYDEVGKKLGTKNRSNNSISKTPSFITRNNKTRDVSLAKKNTSLLANKHKNNTDKSSINNRPSAGGLSGKKLSKQSVSFSTKTTSISEMKNKSRQAPLQKKTISPKLSSSVKSKKVTKWPSTLTDKGRRNGLFTRQPSIKPEVKESEEFPLIRTDMDLNIIVSRRNVVSPLSTSEHEEDAILNRFKTIQSSRKTVEKKRSQLPQIVTDIMKNIRQAKVVSPTLSMEPKWSNSTRFQRKFKENNFLMFEGVTDVIKNNPPFCSDPEESNNSRFSSTEPSTNQEGNESHKLSPGKNNQQRNTNSSSFSGELEESNDLRPCSLQSLQCVSYEVSSQCSSNLEESVSRGRRNSKNGKEKTVQNTRSLVVSPLKNSERSSTYSLTSTQRRKKYPLLNKCEVTTEKKLMNEGVSSTEIMTKMRNSSQNAKKEFMSGVVREIIVKKKTFTTQIIPKAPVARLIECNNVSTLLHCLPNAVITEDNGPKKTEKVLDSNSRVNDETEIELTVENLSLDPRIAEDVRLEANSPAAPEKILVEQQTPCEDGKEIIKVVEKEEKSSVDENKEQIQTLESREDKIKSFYSLLYDEETSMSLVSKSRSLKEEANNETTSRRSEDSGKEKTNVRHETANVGNFLKLLGTLQDVINCPQNAGITNDEDTNDEDGTEDDSVKIVEIAEGKNAEETNVSNPVEVDEEQKHRPMSAPQTDRDVESMNISQTVNPIVKVFYKLEDSKNNTVSSSRTTFVSETTNTIRSEETLKIAISKRIEREKGWYLHKNNTYFKNSTETNDLSVLTLKTAELLTEVVKGRVLDDQLVKESLAEIKYELETEEDIDYEVEKKNSQIRKKKLDKRYLAQKLTNLIKKLKALKRRRIEEDKSVSEGSGTKISTKKAAEIKEKCKSLLEDEVHKMDIDWDRVVPFGKNKDEQMIRLKNIRRMVESMIGIHESEGEIWGGKRKYESLGTKEITLVELMENLVGKAYETKKNLQGKMGYKSSMYFDTFESFARRNDKMSSLEEENKALLEQEKRIRVLVEKILDERNRPNCRDFYCKDEDRVTQIYKLLDKMKTDVELELKQSNCGMMDRLTTMRVRREVRDAINNIEDQLLKMENVLNTFKTRGTMRNPYLTQGNFLTCEDSFLSVNPTLGLLERHKTDSVVYDYGVGDLNDVLLGLQTVADRNKMVQETCRSMHSGKRKLKQFMDEPGFETEKLLKLWKTNEAISIPSTGSDEKM